MTWNHCTPFNSRVAETPGGSNRGGHGLQAKNEVKVLNSLNHPNIVKYYECYQERNMMHIIMEFCQVTCTYHLLLHLPSSTASHLLAS